MRDEQLDHLTATLDEVSEQLADLALELLSEAMGDADPKAAPAAKAERVVTRARRSIEKAVQLLGSINGPIEEEWG